MTYKLKDGRVSAFFGDTNVVLQIDGISNGKEVQFRKSESDTWNVAIENGEVSIPNEFFNGSYKKIIFYVTDGANTIHKGELDVIPRVFPSDYSYEPTKIRTYEDILAEMKGYDDSAKNILNTLEQEAEDVDKAGTQALSDIATAKESAVTLVKTQETTSTKEVQDLGDSIKSNLNKQNTTILSNISAAETKSVNAVQTAQSTAETSIDKKKTEALSAVDTAKSGAVSKIEEDKTTALTAISTKKSDALTEISNKETIVLAEMNSIKSEVDSAASSASSSADSAAISADTAEKKADAASKSADSASSSASAAATSETNAASSATAANTSATNASKALENCNTIETELNGQLNALPFTVTNGELNLIYYR